MIDAVVNIAVFAALGLCIFGFGTWAHSELMLSKGAVSATRHYCGIIA